MQSFVTRLTAVFSMIDIPLEYHSFILLGVLILIVVGLLFKKTKPSFLFGGAVVLLLILGIISTRNFLESISNESILIIFLLIFITTALRKNFNLIELLDGIFSRIQSPRLFILAMTSSVAFLSSLVNNTPIVALLIPYVHNWSKKRGFAPSKFLIPLAYSATLGGMITLIGTSTNLVLNGLIESNGMTGFGFFDFLKLGVIVTVLGIVYFTTIGYHLLPNRLDALEELILNPRDYVMETKIVKGSNIVGKSVKEAKLRNLDGVYLTEVIRKKRLISPVEPDFVLKENDLLYFAGDTTKVIELVQNNRFGLVLNKAEKFQLGKELEVIEALIPITSDLNGKKIRESNFRERFDAAIIAVHRNGHKLGGKIGDVTLQLGDLLLITAGNRFFDHSRQTKDLYVLSVVSKLKKGKVVEKRIFGAVMVALIALMVSGLLSLFIGLLTALSTLLALRLFSVNELKKQLNLDLLIILGSSIALGTAMLETGAASLINDFLFGLLKGKSTIVMISGIFFTTVVLTSFVTNVAAVSVVFPLAASLVQTMGIPEKPVFLAIAFAASAAFLTPVSYQTNLMVYGPGGYTNRDFLKSGFLLTVLYSLICIVFLNQLLAP